MQMQMQMQMLKQEQMQIMLQTFDRWTSSPNQWHARKKGKCEIEETKHQSPQSIILGPNPPKHGLERRIIVQPVPSLLVRSPKCIRDPLVRDSGEFLFIHRNTRQQTVSLTRTSAPKAERASKDSPPQQTYVSERRVSLT